MPLPGIQVKESSRVTICPRCGLPNRPGTSACARCGTQLTAMPPSAALPKAGDANDGLPEWLRPLQSGAIGAPPPGSGPFPPAPNSYNQPGYNQSGGPSGGFGQPFQQGQQWQQPQQGQQPQFSMGTLVSEDALPEWLRQANMNGAPQSQPASRGWDAPVGPPPPAQPQYNGIGAPPIPSAPSNYGGYGQSGQFRYGASGGPTYGTGQNQPSLPSAYGQMQAAGSPPGAINQGTPASTFFDESALPDWMRQAGAQSPAMPAANPYQQAQGGPGMGYGGYQGQPPQPQSSTLMQPAQPLQPVPQPPSNAFPSIDRAGGFQPVPQPQGGLSGQSLLDASALPQWLSGQAGAPAQGGYGGAALSGGMVAQSLVDESALPQWLRAQPDAPTPTTHAAPGFGAAAPAQPAAWNAAPVAEEPLPTWLNQVYSDANVPRTDALQQQASANPWGAAGGYKSSVSGPLAGGFGAGRTNGAPPSEASGVPARQFVDESALPEWLRAQGAAATPSNAMPSAALSGMASMPSPDARAISAYVPPAPSGTPEARPGMSFSASDLIDPDLLPQWVRGDNGAGAGVGNGPPPQATFSSASGWTSKAPAVPGSGLLPPPPSVPAPSWQQSGTSDQLAAWQGNSPSGQGSGPLYGGRPPGSGQLSDDSARFGGSKSSGGGIPVQELPPWLQQAEPARAPERPMGAGRQSMAQAERWDRAPQQQDAGVWDDGYAEVGADFAWDDNAGGYDERGGEHGGGAQHAYGQDGYDPNGYDPNGYDPNGYDANGYDQDGYGQNAYDPNGYDQNGYDPNSYDPDGYDYDAPPEADERSGGWRRLFGRR